METVSLSGSSEIPVEPGGRKRRLLAMGIILVAIIGSAAVGYFFYSSRSNSDISELESLTPSATNEVAEIKNPIDFFYKNFSSKDYKVTVKSGELTSADGNADPVYGGGTHTAVYFFQKGTLVRIDTETAYGDSVTIISKNKKIYNLDNKRKSFSEMDADGVIGSMLLQSFYDASFIGLAVKPIVISSLIPLPKESGDTTGYIAKGVDYGARSDTGKTIQNDIKILIDTRLGLIRTVSLKSTEGSYWNTATLEFEEVLDIESLKTFSKGYAKIEENK